MYFSNQLYSYTVLLHKNESAYMNLTISCLITKLVRFLPLIAVVLGPVPAHTHLGSAHCWRGFQWGKKQSVLTIPQRPSVKIEIYCHLPSTLSLNLLLTHTHTHPPTLSLAPTPYKKSDRLTSAASVYAPSRAYIYPYV